MRGSSAAAFSTIAAVVSADPSSTITTSYSAHNRCPVADARRMASAMFASSLYAGITIESRVSVIVPENRGGRGSTVLADGQKQRHTYATSAVACGHG